MNAIIKELRYRAIAAAVNIQISDRPDYWRARLAEINDLLRWARAA